MLDPPLNEGAVHVTVAERLDAETLAVPMMGASGTVYGVIELLSEEYVPVPWELVAATVKV